MVNVHALGGYEMMARAREAVGNEIKLIGVTQLTSTDRNTLNEELQIAGEVKDSVINLAKLSQKAGLDGVVSSAHEAQLIKDHTSSDFLTVCPGIRLAEDSSDDQKRIMTPEKAFNNGADYIVMGRSITKASNPGLALDNLNRSCECPARRRGEPRRRPAAGAGRPTGCAPRRRRRRAAPRPWPARA